MFARRRFITSLLLVAVLGVPFATHTANAQSTPAGTCTSSDYANPINYIVNSLQSSSMSQPSAIGSALIAVIGIRYQYETATPPAGCESAQPLILQYLGVQEDGLYTAEAAKVDTANKDAYNEILNNLAPARYKAVIDPFNASLANAHVSNSATAPAVPTGAAAATPQTCTDSAFIAQVKTDTAVLSGGMSTAVPAIKLRYKYEDLAAPSGCEDGRRLLVESFALAEDVAAMSIMAQADTANAATYTDFLNKTIGVRGASLSSGATAAFPSLAATPAPTASS